MPLAKLHDVVFPECKYIFMCIIYEKFDCTSFGEDGDSGLLLHMRDVARSPPPSLV